MIVVGSQEASQSRKSPMPAYTNHPLQFGFRLLMGEVEL